MFDGGVVFLAWVGISDKNDIVLISFRPKQNREQKNWVKDTFFRIKGLYCDGDDDKDDTGAYVVRVFALVRGVCGCLHPTSSFLI